MMVEFVAMERRRTTTQTALDSEFLSNLVNWVERYFRAVDEWETEYQKFSRLAGAQRRVPANLEDAQREFVSARQDLEAAIPRARWLCRKFEIRDPWPGLLLVGLGSETAQAHGGSAIGRNERIAVRDCLRDLQFRCGESELHSAFDGNAPERRSVGLLRRFWDYFS